MDETKADVPEVVDDPDEPAADAAADAAVLHAVASALPVVALPDVEEIALAEGEAVDDVEPVAEEPVAVVPVAEGAVPAIAPIAETCGRGA